MNGKTVNRKYFQGKAMKKIIYSSLLLIEFIYTGCGYTVLKNDHDNSEYLTIDSLSCAPDLIIDNITYEVHPPFIERNYPIARLTGYPGSIDFYLTIKNRGNKNFSQPFAVYWKYSSSVNPFNWYIRTEVFNKNGYEIYTNEEVEFKLLTDFFDDPATIEFLIVTNPLIQKEADCSYIADKYFVSKYYYYQVPLCRELNYSNNSYTIKLPGFKNSFKRGIAQPIKSHNE